MSQCGWYIWRARRVFPSIEEMIVFVHETVEQLAHKGGPDGTVTMIGWDDHPHGVALNSIADWQESVIWQVQSASQYFERLIDAEEKLEERI